MILSRRSLITGLVSFVAAPAIVRASSIMPVRPFLDDWTSIHEATLKRMLSEFPTPVMEHMSRLWWSNEHGLQSEPLRWDEVFERRGWISNP